MTQTADNRPTFLSSSNAEYIAHLYKQYLVNPNLVDQSWQDFFTEMNDDEAAILRELNGASWTPEENKRSRRGFGHLPGVVNTGESAPQQAVNANKSGNISDEEMRQMASDSVNALMLIRAYRMRGHLLANLDPLDLKDHKEYRELEPSFYGFTDSDYDRKIFINGVLGQEYATLREIMTILRRTYCDKIGVEFLHLTDPEEKAWVQERIEAPMNHTDFTENGKRAILQRLTAAEGLESFLGTKYVGTKRFGLDGGESLIPAIEQIMKRGGQLGLNEIVVGMAHRGRLNVLTNVMGKTFTALFAEFQGKPTNPESVQGSGDVKYHMGTSSDRDFDGNVIHLSLTPNPSHLECVNPVVIGKVRAKQVMKKDYECDQVLPLLLHGDAAFAGQGVVAETLMMSELPGYRIGGTIHIVINNQIGFTTTPKYGRSGPYPTDVAKMLAAPIFHVNGDDPEAVVHVARIATEFRQRFKKDVVIDLVCYRRNGHNEGDEPAFTQPIMYKKIKTHETVRSQYAKELIGEGILSEDEAQEMIDEFKDYMERAFEDAKSFKPNKADWLEGDWSNMKEAPSSKEPRKGDTAVSKSALEKVGKAITQVPDDFEANKKILRQLDAKAEMFKSGEGFDWATGEAAAFGTLLNEGYSVRLSGQDVGRGTFSQRHAILYDQTTEEKYIPLQHIDGEQGRFEAHDSPLSEFAVLGYEYGYSIADPNTLVLWEAQFGDFVNGAQTIIDQFISSGETKWLRMSGLVMLLPHGSEGQGPEHSSARPERFLQLCAEDNMQVCNLTTPANYFHALRRQMNRNFRKPLIIMTPKSLLRHKLCVSKLEDMTGKTSFHRVLPDDAQKDLKKADKIKRVVLCSGKVYYDLYEKRAEEGIDDIALVRVEQLYPFPHETLVKELKQYKNAEFIWCQEEPKNQGYWSFVSPYVEEVLTEIKAKNTRPDYVGRVSAAAPATGFAKVHAQEQEALVKQALKLK
tara:strand:+ start:130666 stop:133578 length:2913 start_codon:yes stop_codon:yes gene_type:complete